MSSCLSGGRTIGFDLEIVKPPSPSPAYSSSSSPSSTISESSNSPLAISTKKPRTPRKRPNQSCSEAAALLATIYPNVFFSNKSLREPFKDSNYLGSFSESSELLLPFPAIDKVSFLLQDDQIQDKSISQTQLKMPFSRQNACRKSCLDEDDHNRDFHMSSAGACTSTIEEDFDVESILDEEKGEGVVGIDSIMGNASMGVDACDGANNYFSSSSITASCYIDKFPIGREERVWSWGWPGEFGWELGSEFGGGIRALRRAGGDCDWWWRSPTIEILDITPNLKPLSPPPTEKKKKMKKKIETRRKAEPHQTDFPRLGSSNCTKEDSTGGLGLKLNYDQVLSAWSEHGGSPYSDEIPTLASPDAIARLAQLDLISDIGSGIGGVREASVLRYKEKRRTRLFSKKIRYQVRKVNADQRPRMKGRFVRRPGLH